MKTLMTLLALLVSITVQTAKASDGSENNNNSPAAKVTAYLQQQAELDLAGKKSCFKGALLKKSNQMEEEYGGRYSPSVEIQVAEADATQYRYISKYCDEAVNGQRVCDSTDEFTYAVAARFSSATSGTFETEAKIFKVKKDVRFILVVKDNASYHADEDEIISEKVITTHTCTPISF